MQTGILQENTQQSGLKLDPRTKLLLLITISVLVLGGVGSDHLPLLVPLLCLLVFGLLLTARKYRAAFFYLAVYSCAYFAAVWILPHLSGFPYFLLLGSAGIFSRVMPGVAMGAYVVGTTTVSEFTAAMQKMHVSEKIIIPMSVMFRFFPTVGEEFASINAAMRMRGIRFGGGKIGKMLEYRLVPLLTCSAKIGEELSAAALTRGLGGEIRRTNICKIGFHAQDWCCIDICVLAFAAVLLARLGIAG